MPYPNEHAARLKDPKTLKSIRVKRTNGSGGGTVQGIKVPKTITVIWYIVDDEGTEIPIAQALRFPIKDWTENEAKSWLKDNKIKYILFEPAEKEKQEQEDSMEHKQILVPFQLKEYNEDDEYYSFTGYASTFGNEDLGNDVVIQGAFTASLKKRIPKLCYQHDIYKVIGAITQISEDGKGLYVAGKLPKKHSLAKDVAELIKIGGIDSMSIGYSVVEADVDNAANLRYLTKLDLYEISFVTFPMNERAKINGFKMVVPYQNLDMADKETGYDREAACNRIKEWAGCGDKPNNAYRKAFLYIDDDSKDQFGGYRFQIADVVNGYLKAIPRAIYAVAGAIQSSRGTDGMSDDELEAVKKNVSKYYKKLGIRAPWDKEEDEKSIKEVIDNIRSMKDVNEFLREKGLTSEERKGIIAKAKSVDDDRRKDEEMIVDNVRLLNDLVEQAKNL